MMSERIKAGDCAWLKVVPCEDFCCSKCNFQFGDDNDDDKKVLVLVCHASRSGKSNCPNCGEVNIFTPGVMFRVRRLIAGRLITEQADMPIYWLIAAATEEVSDYFLDDEESGESWLQRCLE